MASIKDEPRTNTYIPGTSINPTELFDCGLELNFKTHDQQFWRLRCCCLPWLHNTPDWSRATLSLPSPPLSELGYRNYWQLVAVAPVNTIQTKLTKLSKKNPKTSKHSMTQNEVRTLWLSLTARESSVVTKHSFPRGPPDTAYIRVPK